jgi:hypothetical protein
MQRKEVSLKKRAMTSEKASFVKTEGHRIEKVYGDLINGVIIPGTGKIDIKDKNGKFHSVKGAELKWQIFLYGKSRFEKEFGELGKLFVKCIESFPEKRNDYLINKDRYKDILKENMINLRKYLENDEKRKKFFAKAFLNDQINYFVIYDKGIFHIFDAQECIENLGSLTEAENSKARSVNQRDAQKVIFKHEDKTIGEIEMRNDSEVHYRQVKFWMEKKGTTDLLIRHIPVNKRNNGLILYGEANDTFLK